MTSSAFSSRAKIMILCVLILLICIFVLAARGFMPSDMTMDSIVLATSTHAPFYSMVQLSKPTYTPTPLPTLAPTVEVSPTLDPPVEVDLPLDTSLIVDPSQVEQAQDVESVYSGNKYILVDISEQHMYVYEGDILANSFIASTGINNGTRVGSFSVLDKIPNAYGATWDLWMPNWLGIYWSGSLENGIHALPILSSGSQLWAGYLGTPISFGCVVLGVDEAQWLYDWAEVGTPVDIQW
jgi:lipoprotein-anchoring transpeptidase ErfK/SrfK